MLSPFAPHMCRGTVGKLGHTGGVVAAGWPAFDEAVAKADEIVVPVQVNGKVCARVDRAGGLNRRCAERAGACGCQVVMKHLEGKTVRKVVVAGGQGSRLVSIVVS